MTTTLKLGGMSCMHCAGKVKAALEGISGVTEATVSVDDQSAIVESTQDVPEDQFRTAVEASGYQFAGKA